MKRYIGEFKSKAVNQVLAWPFGSRSGAPGVMCLVLGVHRSGFYACPREQTNAREVDDRLLLGTVKQAWLESGTIYGYRNVSPRGDPYPASRPAGR